MKKICIIIFALILDISCASASSSFKEKIESAIQNYASTRFLNATYMFADDQNTLAIGAHGIRSLKTNDLLKENEQMPIASITKSMTAASILKLQDRKQLHVLDTVAKHLTDKSNIWTNNKVPSWAEKVTIHDLLTHRSGLTEYFMNLKIDVTKSHAQINKDIVNFAGGFKLKFEPGSEYSYNNTNFVLLGLIIEQVSGQPLAKFYEKELFIPLGMKSTRLLSLDETVKSQMDPKSSPVPTRYFVTPTAGVPQFSEAKSEFIMVPFADGGVVSTNGDLIRWHKGLHDGKILSDESYKLMTTKHYEIPDKTGAKTYIGYGLFISTLWEGCDSYYHAGKALAIRGESGYVPSKNLYFSVLSNVMMYVPKEMEASIDMTKPENQLDIYFFVNYVLQALK